MTDRLPCPRCGGDLRYFPGGRRGCLCAPNAFEEVATMPREGGGTIHIHAPACNICGGRGWLASTSPITRDRPCPCQDKHSPLVLVPMRAGYDDGVAALATACGVPYERAHEAAWGPAPDGKHRSWNDGGDGAKGARRLRSGRLLPALAALGFDASPWLLGPQRGAAARLANKDGMALHWAPEGRGVAEIRTTLRGAYAAIRWAAWEASGTGAARRATLLDPWPGAGGEGYGVQVIALIAIRPDTGNRGT